ncbi:MAG: carboxypeptidase regulatory-like domain-containing protein [Candidatus Hatepunaea meridiana]|nr:carboxypeptidase regulatory-like domain-containing protein [Candidatus Hatepunaea meridiana]
MRTFKPFILLLSILLLGYSINANADIIEVPEDRNTIQSGINAADDGDTVLVHPGEYRENIDFGGRTITVGSLFLTTGDEAYIDSTVIDGNDNGPVVHFHNRESADARLSGFILENGSGYRSGENTFGGAIHNWVNSSPTLDHLIIQNSSATNGGGIYCQDTEHQIISHVTIKNCSATYGGGIRLLRGSAALDYVCLHDNSAQSVGGAMQIVWAADALLVNVTMCRNSSPRGGGIYISATGEQNTVSTAELVNTIIWGNSDNNIYFSSSYEPSTMSFDYCDIEGGEDDILLNNNGEIAWGDGNIDDDPDFVDADDGDFHLEDGSPCINTGSPESPEDPDGSRADIGAFPFFSQNAFLKGRVLDIEDNNPLSEAIVITSLGQEAVTNEEGFWEIENAWTGAFNVTASKSGYNDSTQIDLRLRIDDTLRVNFSLRHPEFIADPDEINVELPQGNSTEVGLSVFNTGNGPLELTVEPRTRGEEAAEPWELRRSVNVGFLLDDNQIHGVAFAENQFFVSGTNGDDPPIIYVLNREGDMTGSFEQVGRNRIGMRDLAYDGNLIWGSGEGTVFGFTTDGEQENSFQGPFNQNTAIAWDPDNDLLWICGTISEYIAGYDRFGDEVMAVDPIVRNIFGLAYWQDDPDEHCLYLFHSPGAERQIVSKINVNTNDIIEVIELEPEGGGRPVGTFICNTYDPMSWVFMDVSNPGENDRIDIWQLSARSGWFEIDPVEGEIPPGESTDFIITFDASDLIPNSYEGELYFRHNADGEEMALPVTLDVQENSVREGLSIIPDEFHFSEPYPNPFNATMKISYSLPVSSSVLIRVYDVYGRLIATLVNAELSAGNYSTEWNGLSNASGVYFVKMEAVDFYEFRKVTLLK